MSSSPETIKAQQVPLGDFEKNGIPLSSLPLAIWDGKVEEEEHVEESNSTTPSHRAVNKEVTNRKVEKAAPLDAPAFKSRTELGLNETVTRKVRPETNAGISRASRKYIRGVLHPYPHRLLIAAIVTLIHPFSLLSIPLAMALVYWKALPITGLAIALIFPASLIIQLIIASRARCQICGLKEFLPSSAIKHHRAHRWLFFSPAYCTAVHLLSFKWFRCVFCGTSIRLKE